MNFVYLMFSDIAPNMIARIQDASLYSFFLISKALQLLKRRVAYGAALAFGSCLRLLSSTSRTDQSGASYFPIVVRRSVTANVRPMHFDFKVDFN